MFKKIKKTGEFRFSLQPSNGVKKVALAGDFTQWQPVRMRKQKTGEFATDVVLPDGQHQYKFMVDDVWMTDPENSETMVNEFGTLNSVVSVP
jgi:1,4-alpha-glucan branching enzyme